MVSLEISPRPDHVPQGVDEILGKASHRRAQLGEKTSPALSQVLADGRRHRAFHRHDGPRQLGVVVGEVERDPAIVGPDRVDPTPDELSGRTQLVEIRRRVVAYPLAQHVALEHRRRDGRPLKLLDGLEQPIESTPGLDHPLPVRQETSERRWLHRLDLLAQAGQRVALEATEHPRVAPLTPLPPRQELALEHPIGHGQVLQGRQHRRHADAQARRDGPAPERARGSAHSERPDPRAGDAPARETPRVARAVGTIPSASRRRPQSSAATKRCGIGHAHRDDATGRRVQGFDPLVDPAHRPRTSPRSRRGRGRRAKGKASCSASAWRMGLRPSRRWSRSCCSSIASDVEELPQLRIPQKLPQLGLVERQGRRPTLGQRHVVVVVQEGPDPGEQDGRGEGRGAARICGPHPDLARLDVAQDARQPREVEYVPQTLTEGLENDRELGVVGRPRRADRRPGGAGPKGALRRPGMRRGSSRARAAFSRKRRANIEVPLSSATTRSSISSPRGKKNVDIRGTIGFGQAKRDPVVGPQGVDLESELVTQPAVDRHRPRGVNPHAVGREQHDPPVSDLVHETLDHDGSGRSGSPRWPRADPARRRRDSWRPARRVRGASVRRSIAGSSSVSASSRASVPTERPNSTVRPRPSPRQKGIRPGSPGAGTTRTRSWVISVIRQPARTEQEDVTRARTRTPSPRRARPPGPAARSRCRRPERLRTSRRSGIVPALTIAVRFAPRRASTVPPMRSQVMRGRSSLNSSEG